VNGSSSRPRLKTKNKGDNSKTEGIEASEIEHRKSPGECLRCAWPSDRKGNHRVKDCMRPIKLDKGTANYPKAKEYQKMKIAGIELDSEEEDCSDSESSESSDDDSSSSEEEDLECEYFEEEEETLQEEEEEGNWWDSPEDSD
jgi:hypothetical protein